MGVLGGGNDHRINVIDLLVEIAEVDVITGALAPGKAGGGIEVFLIYVAKGNHLLVAASSDVTTTTPPDPDQTNCQLSVG